MVAIVGGTRGIVALAPGATLDHRGGRERATVAPVEGTVSGGECIHALHGIAIGVIALVGGGEHRASRLRAGAVRVGFDGRG